MLKKIFLTSFLTIALFLGYISTREGKFRYERSGLIQASREQIFPYISNLRRGSEWSPYEKMAPNMKKKYYGEEGQVGSKMEFESKEAGSGTLELLSVLPHDSVELRLLMTAPLAADHLIRYQLTAEGEATRFSWIMTGDGGFVGKLMTFFIDCDKMVGDQFTQGIENLKAVVEKRPPE